MLVSQSHHGLRTEISGKNILYAPDRKLCAPQQPLAMDSSQMHSGIYSPRMFKVESASITNNRFFTPDGSGKCVTYSIINGVGEPSADLGLIGDIYLDLTPDHYQLYGKSNHGWVIWSTAGEIANLVTHPQYPELILWCSVKYFAMGWLPQDRLTVGELIVARVVAFLIPC